MAYVAVGAREKFEPLYDQVDPEPRPMVTTLAPTVTTQAITQPTPILNTGLAPPRMPYNTSPNAYPYSQNQFGWGWGLPQIINITTPSAEPEPQLALPTQSGKGWLVAGVVGIALAVLLAR